MFMIHLKKLKQTEAQTMLMLNKNKKINLIWPHVINVVEVSLSIDLKNICSIVQF